jgi:hypothetical protein
VRDVLGTSSLKESPRPKQGDHPAVVEQTDNGHWRLTIGPSAIGTAATRDGARALVEKLDANAERER